MTDNRKPIDDEAIEGLSVTPPRPDEDDDAVDIGSEDSMDASDPPSTSAPGSDRERDVEQAREEARQKDA